MPPISETLPNQPALHPWRARLRASGIHFLVSAVAAGCTALVVFLLWYPTPYDAISGGRDLFMLIVAVDVILGPLLTLAVFNVEKPVAELRRDLCVVAVLQVAALLYGLWTVNLARPVHMVFEIDRFRVVHRNDIPVELASTAPAGMPIAPLSGPTVLSLREFNSPTEEFELTVVALGGVPLSAQPGLWQPYEKARKRVLKAAKPLEDLRRRFRGQESLIDAALQQAGMKAGEVVYLPVIGRRAEAWTVLLNSGTGGIIGFLPLDSF